MKNKLFIVIVMMFIAGTLSASPLAITDVDDVYPFVPNWSTSRVLHIGDSQMKAGLQAKMAKHLRDKGAIYRGKQWKGSRSKSWVISGKAKRLIDEFKPNVVIITLGTNVMISNKPSRHMGWVRALIERVGNRACYWMGPPPVFEDKHGFVDLLSKQMGKCRYFDSNKLNIKKKKSFHLTKNQGEMWADMVWNWMNGN